MNSKQKNELKHDLSKAYSMWMQQLHIKWSGKIDKHELRIESARHLINHALTQVTEEHRRNDKKVSKTNRLISLLETRLEEQEKQNGNRNQHPRTDNRDSISEPAIPTGTISTVQDMV